MRPAALIRPVLLVVVVALALALPASAMAAAANDARTVSEDSAPDIVDVLANDNPPGGPAGTAQIQTVALPMHGTTRILDGNQDQITYEPEADYCGSDSFSYSGDYGGANVEITVECVDDPPLATDDPSSGSYHVDEDSGPVDYDVLANDTDIDGGPKLITALGTAERGTATLMGSKVRYAPTANLCGASLIKYTLNDSVFLFQKAALTVDADCKPDLPVATNDVFSVGFNAGTTLLPVVANDTDADDLNELLSEYADIPIIGVTQPLNGTAEIVQGVADRTDRIAYRPRAGFCGTDSFAYRVLRDEVPLGQVTVTVPCPAPSGSPAPQNVPAPRAVAPVLKPSPGAKTGAPKIVGTALRVPLTCTTAASCSVGLSLTTATTGASAAARKKKAVMVGKAKVTLRPGQKRTVSVKLNAAGRRALKKAGRLRAKLVVTLGTKTVSSRGVTFRVKRKR